MCGILALLDIPRDLDRARALAVKQVALLRHRGPDWTGTWSGGRAVLAHERLAIVDVLHGAQPLRSPDGTLALAVNGEIYNHRDLRAEIGASWSFATDSDCEPILPLYQRHGPHFLAKLRGMYAFVIADGSSGKWMIGRDHIGIVPLYVGRTPEGATAVASELKALLAICTSVREFPPGHYQTESDPEPVRWWHPQWTAFDAVPDRDLDVSVIRDALSESVHSHLMSDVPYGVLLSGGLDSSVVAALAARFAEQRVESGDRDRAWWPRLHTFSIGLPGSPDVAAAAKVAQALGTVHHAFSYTLEEGLDAIRDVIWHTETYDVTTIRAATPMMLLARRIRTLGVKMVLSGEGSDELFGGYLYFHKAPHPRAFHEELVRKLDALHLYDCLRANKAMAAWGVEARVPFLDCHFIDVVMNIHARHKMAGAGRIEKRILREAFDGWLPGEILWRQKEQFSDGVGYGWIDGLKAHAGSVVSDRMLADAPARFPVGIPKSKEAYLYRSIFDELFPLPSAAACVPSGPSVACSTAAALAWDPSLQQVVDPSGRAVRGVHENALDAPR
jgi:asparagine synthase (glutamine-hydrolysing)